MEKMKLKFKQFVGWLYVALRSLFSPENIKKFLKDSLMKAAIKKFVVSGGLKGMLISFVVEELVEEADEHLIEPFFRKMNLFKDIVDGEVIYKRVENAENRDDWRDAVRDS